MHSDFITDEMLANANLDTAAAPDIIFGAQLALLARGVADAERLVPALLSAAWACHSDLYGEDTSGAFSNLLRGWADGIDKTSIVN